MPAAPGAPGAAGVSGRAGVGGGASSPAPPPPPDLQLKETACVGYASGTPSDGGGSTFSGSGSGGSGTVGRTKAIAAVQFGTMSPAEMVRLSAIQVCR